MKFRDYLEGSTTWYIDGKNVGSTVNGHGYLKECITEFFKEEFGEDEFDTDRPAIEPDFSDLEHVGLVYTEADDCTPLWWYADIPHKRIVLQICGKIAIEKIFEYYLEMGDYLKNLLQGELVCEGIDFYENDYIDYEEE